MAPPSRKPMFSVQVLCHVNAPKHFLRLSGHVSHNEAIIHTDFFPFYLSLSLN